jgi:hypothetical protein
MATPAEIPRQQLRLAVVEAIIRETIDFVRSDGAAGPIFQRATPDGGLIQSRSFLTRFPHLLIERTERFERGATVPTEVTWSVRRVHDPHERQQSDRLLETVNLAFRLARAFL